MQTIYEYLNDGGSYEALEGVEARLVPDGEAYQLHFCSHTRCLYVYGYRRGTSCPDGTHNNGRMSYFLKDRDGRNAGETEALNDLIIDIKTRNKPKKSKTRPFGPQGKARFYQAFQIGVEIEGEFKKSSEYIEEASENYFTSENDSIKSDGSISATNGGYELELVTPIIDTIGEETLFLRALRALETGGNFATSNASCGTHVHLDIKPSWLAKQFPDIAISQGSSYALKLLDSVEFETYFFREYFSFFTMPKFWNRLKNSYCKTYAVRGDGRGMDDMSEVEQLKDGRDRYSWLNYQSLMNGTGIEFRIFPYMTSSNGVADVVKFVQSTVLSYWKKKATKARLQLIADFYAGKFTINQATLNTYDKMLYKAFKLDSRRPHLVSYDQMEFMAYISKKQSKN